MFCIITFHQHLYPQVIADGLPYLLQAMPVRFVLTWGYVLWGYVFV